MILLNFLALRYPPHSHAIFSNSPQPSFQVSDMIFQQPLRVRNVTNYL